MELGFRIPIVSGIPDSLSCIPDSKSQIISRIPQAKSSRDSGIRNPYSLIWGENKNRQSVLRGQLAIPKGAGARPLSHPYQMLWVTAVNDSFESYPNAVEFAVADLFSFHHEEQNVCILA